MGVPRREELRSTIIGISSSARRCAVVGTQTKPLPYLIIRFIASGVHFSAAMMKSPSFSRSSSSTTMTMRPWRISSIASSIGLHLIGWRLLSLLRRVACGLLPRVPYASLIVYQTAGGFSRENVPSPGRRPSAPGRIAPIKSVLRIPGEGIRVWKSTKSACADSRPPPYSSPQEQGEGKGTHAGGFCAFAAAVSTAAMSFSTMQIKTFTLCLLCLVASSATLGQANEQVGPAAEGRTLLPTRQLIRAAGRTLEFGGRPIDLALSPDGKTLYAKDNRGLVVVKVADWKVIQELPLEGGTSLHGVVVRRDGARVYATGAQSQLAEAEVLPDGALRWKRQILLPGPEGKGASYPCGLALNAAGTRAYVCLSRNNTLGVVDLVSGTLLSEIPVGVAPFDVALSRDGSQAYVSDWGGRRPKPGEKTAPSAGTETLVDARGVASSGCVSLVDLR